MGRLRNLISRVSEKFLGKRKSELSKNSVPLFEYDRMTVDNEVNSNPELAKLVNEGEERNTGFQNLMQDLFGGLYKENPSLLPEEDIAEEYRANRQHMADVMDSEGYEDLRSTTKLNEALALASAQDLAQRILEKSPRESSDRRRIQEMEQELQELLNEASEAVAAGASAEEQEALAEAIEETEKDLESLIDQAERTSRSASASGHQIKAEVERQAEQVKALVQMLRSFGYTKEQLSRVTTDTMVKMLKDVMFKPELKRLAELIGRFRRIANRLLSKSKQEEHFSITGVTIGDNIEDVTPRELVCALHPTLRFDFLRRWQEGELEVWEREDEVESGKGPIVACVDVSSSMQGDKDSYAKALLMAYLEIAKKQHRDMSVIFFNGYLQKEYKIKRGRIRPDLLIEILSFPPSGGTNFEHPLGRGRDVIAQESSMKTADILFITDGSSQVSSNFLDHFNAERKRLGFKVISAFVETQHYWGREECLELLRSFSDAVFNVQELTEESAEAIIGSILDTDSG